MVSLRQKPLSISVPRDLTTIHARNCASSDTVSPEPSGIAPIRSIGSLCRFTQYVGNPNNFAPAASQPPNAAKRISSRLSLKASTPS
jgi:hypothetical protein